MTPCVIFDLDGTLADVRHRLHHVRKSPPDWKSFFEAGVDDPVILSSKQLAEVIYFSGPDRSELVICSGRPRDYETESRAWLLRHGIFYDRLMMRPSGDTRPDHVIKKEMLDRLRSDGYEVKFSVDDRPSVVKMWRENGVPCFACDDTPWKTNQNHFDSHAEYPHVGKTLLTLMVGPSGAGKSTWLAFPAVGPNGMTPAYDFGISENHVLSSDQIRHDLCGNWMDQSRNDEVFAALHAVARARLNAGLPTVIDATHLRRKDRLAAAALAPEGSRVRYIVMNRPLSEKLGNNKGIPVGVTSKHDHMFKSQLADILAGDGLPNVDVVDLRR